MIDLVIDQRRKDLGGFEVGRVLPYAKRRMVGPFVFFDHMGPVDFQAGFPGPSTSAHIRTSASPPSPICSTARSPTAIPSASLSRSSPAR